MGESVFSYNAYLSQRVPRALLTERATNIDYYEGYSVPPATK